MTSMNVPLIAWWAAVLLGVELDDERLAHRNVDVVALGQIPNGDLLAGVAGLEPADDVAVDDVEVVLDHDHVARLGGQADDFTLVDSVAGDVDALAVDVDEAVADELAGLRTRACPAGAVDDVVQALLEETQQVLTGRALQAHGLFVGVAELTLEDAVDVLRLLLLLQLGEVLAAGIAASGAAMRARGERTTLEGLAALVVLEDVGAESARDAHFRAGVTSHVRSGPAALRLTAAVVGYGRDIFDRGDLDAGLLNAANRSVATGTRTLHLHFDSAEAVFHRGAGRLFRCHLRSERRALARTLEADAAGRRPRDDVALCIGDRHDRVVEGALDVDDTDSDVLALALAWTTPTWLRLGHYFLTAFFLLATVFFGPLRVRALVCVRWPRTGRPLRWRTPW